GAFMTGSTGMATFTISIATLAAGPHAISLVAYDDRGAASEPYAIEVAIIDASIERAGCRVLSGATTVVASSPTISTQLRGAGARTIEVSLDGTFPGTNVTPFTGAGQTIEATLPAGPADYVADGSLLAGVTVSVRFTEGDYHVDRTLAVLVGPN